MRVLHILNGDCALAGWLDAGFTGEVLVWRENYLEGTMPQTADIELFNRIRADELHRLVPEKSADLIFAELQTMHQTLFSLRREDKLILWLDCCPFDEALKKRLLALISSMPEPPEVKLIQRDLVWNADAFRKYRHLNCD